MVKCVVSGCPNRVCSRGVLNRPPKRFFNFPKDPARVKVWLAALRETDKQDSTEQQFICEDHFLSDHITPQGVSDDAIPIMPPYLDGPLGVISPWGAESSEEEEQWAGKDEAADEDEDDEAAAVPGALPAHLQLSDGGEQDPPQPEAFSGPAPQPGKEVTQSKRFTRNDVSLGCLTKRFLELMLAAPDGVLDLRQVAASLHTRRRRVYDITNVLDGVCLIKKQSANTIKWISRSPVSSFLGRSHQRFHRELENLKTVEQTLDGLIKTCAQQLFDMTDDTQNTESAYVMHDDIRHIRVFQEQTVIIIKAPEETKLEVPTPREDSIQVHLKGGKGPIKVLTCEMDRPGDAATSDPDPQSRCFTTLEESRISTSTLHTETSTPQSAMQSA